MISDTTAYELARAIGERIRAARIRLGISQEGLALSAGLSRAYVGSIERGERDLSVRVVWKLAYTLKAPISEILPITLLGDGATGANEGGNDTSAPLPTDSRYEPHENMGHTGQEVERLLTTGAAARRLSLSRRTLERWAKRGRVARLLVEDNRGKLFSVFRLSDIERLVDAVGIDLE
jgi:transcriptional regulator with XRE-family HTH domain